MDFVTHAAVGALVGRAVAPSRRGAGLVGAVAALAPDADHVLEWRSAADYFLYHRTATHSLLFVGAAVAGALALRGARPLERAAVVGAALLSHLFLDLLTPFGTGLLWPFSDALFALDGLPIFAPWILGTAVLAAAIALPRAGRVPALLALGFLAVAVSWQWSVARRAERAVPGGAALAVPDWRSPFHAVAFVRDDAFVSLLRVDAAGRARVEWSRPSGAELLAGVPPHLTSRLRVPIAREKDGATAVHDAQLEVMPIPGGEPPIRIVRDERGVRVEQQPLGVQPIIWLAVVGVVVAIGLAAGRWERRAEAA